MRCAIICMILIATPYIHSVTLPACMRVTRRYHGSIGDTTVVAVDQAAHNLWKVTCVVTSVYSIRTRQKGPSFQHSRSLSLYRHRNDTVRTRTDYRKHGRQFISSSQAFEWQWCTETRWWFQYYRFWAGERFSPLWPAVPFGRHRLLKSSRMKLMNLDLDCLMLIQAEAQGEVKQLKAFIEDVGHFSLVRNFRLADCVTIMNGVCGSLSVFNCGKYLITQERSYLWWVSEENTSLVSLPSHPFPLGHCVDLVSVLAVFCVERHAETWILYLYLPLSIINVPQCHPTTSPPFLSSFNLITQDRTMGTPRWHVLWPLRRQDCAVEEGKQHVRARVG